jgi:uncharacterized protein (TIGR04255 family)
MNLSSSHLPSFCNPPLHEMALGVQFSPIIGLDVFSLESLRSLYIDEFPLHEIQAPLEPVYEQFGTPVTTGSSIRFKPINQSDFIPRCWFLSTSRDRLIQIQPDRFVHNWRKHAGGGEYPRYEAVKNSFGISLSKLIDYCSNKKLSAWIPNQCEVIYINHIISGEVWKLHSEVGKIMANFSEIRPSLPSAQMEDIRLNERFVYFDRDNKPFARLHVGLTPAFSVDDNSPMYILKFTFRGTPSSQDLAGVYDFFDTGREIVVRAFAEITNPEMHPIWEREQ